MLEQRCKLQEIELYYGNETQISEEGYVPYGWQFSDGNVCIRSAKGKKINCFGMITRDNEFVYQTTTQTIGSDFVIELLDKFSFPVIKHTVVVLDNARVHRSKKVKQMQKNLGKKRAVHFLSAPQQSPHLNIIERLWKEIKARWLRPGDYLNEQQLFYATNLILAAIGKDLKINFSKQQIN